MSTPKSKHQAHQRLPIIPAIPRKLEKRSNDRSNVTTTWPTSANVEQADVRPAALDEANPHGDNQHAVNQESGISAARPQELVKKDLSGENRIDIATPGTMQLKLAASDESPTALDSMRTALDPSSPPFVPEAANISPEKDGLSSCLGDEDVVSTKANEPAVSPRLPHPTSAWVPSHTMPTGNPTLFSPPQPYQEYSTPSPMYYSTAPPHPKYPNATTYYTYHQPHHQSMHPQNTPSYINASPAQSSYEGYAIANTPHVVHSRPGSSSRHSYLSSATFMPNASPYTPFQQQRSFPQLLPQFGSHFPITPSTTPSNSGSQKLETSPVDSTETNATAPISTTAGEFNQDETSKAIGQEYQVWCAEQVKSLKEVNNPWVSFSPLSSHLLNNFNDPAFADCELYMSHTKYRFEPAVVSLHSLLIAQNPKLRALLHDAEIREDGKKQILLSVKDSYTDPTALKTALKACYGEHPSAFSGFPGKLSSESQMSTTWMGNALAYAAAGHLVEMAGVAHRGEQIASAILRWDNLGQSISYSLDPSIRRIWGSSSDDPASLSSNASEVLLSCLYFIINNISDRVRLDLEAKPITAIDRLPAGPDHHRQSSKPRLSRIQFGELPIVGDEPASQQDVLASRILLSLPFRHLKFILDRVPIDVNRKIGTPLVEERERRRLRARNAQSDTIHMTSEQALALAQEERLVATDGENEEARFSLDRS
ncbi:MAG: hypothetical protein Q9220_001070 [cf. Caloplaca sp. 1 TL-2023]